MARQTGFTLIELLLVLAIIGIISAIAIPALLGQRARSRDTAARGNADSTMADLIGQYDAQKGAGNVPTTGTALIGTAAAPLIPQAFTAVNPWITAGCLPGFNTAAFAVEDPLNPGVPTATLAAAGTQGQVQLGFVAPVGADGKGVLAASVWLGAAFQVNGATVNNFTKTSGVD